MKLCCMPTLLTARKCCFVIRLYFHFLNCIPLWASYPHVSPALFSAFKKNLKLTQHLRHLIVMIWLFWQYSAFFNMNSGNLCSVNHSGLSRPQLHVQQHLEVFTNQDSTKVAKEFTEWLSPKADKNHAQLTSCIRWLEAPTLHQPVTIKEVRASWGPNFWRLNAPTFRSSWEMFNVLKSSPS